MNHRPQETARARQSNPRPVVLAPITPSLLAITALLVFLPSSSAQLTNYLRLHSFGRTNLLGSNPLGAMVQGSDKAIYGVTRAGGLYVPGSIGFGTAFNIQPDGTAYGLVHQFGDTNDPSASPATGLLLGKDGWLYGSSYSGTVFKLRPDGSGYRLLTDSNFTATVGSGFYPLAFGSDGMLYGTSDSAVFKLDTNGTSLAVLLMPLDYFPAFNAIIQGSDGLLYGTSQYGVTNDNGTLFRLDTNGNNFVVLHEFTGTNGDGASPRTGLIETKAGLLFGATASGGSNGLGTIFKLSRDGAGYAVVHSFARTNDTALPNVLIEASDSMLYGTGESGYGAVFRMRPDGSDYKLIKVFTGGPNDGSLFRGGLLEGTDGILYGATELGGRYGLGTLFRLSKDGSAYTVLRHFLPWPADGINPRIPLLQASDGALYGATDSNGSDVNGSVFRINNDGSGYAPLADVADYMGGPLWEGAGGQLRGMTSDYIVFTINKDGSGFTWLLNLQALLPYAPLVETPDATFYGASQSATSAPNGSVFAVTSNHIATLLHSFTGSPGDGRFPGGPLLKASDGLLYGVTSGGGLSNTGTVFRLSLSGDTYAVLHHFSGDAAGGASPYGQLLEASDGALYGLATFGGGTNQGFIYKLHKDGSGFQGLKAFTGSPADGSLPAAPLVEGQDGALYGFAMDFAGTGLGTLFRLNKDGSGFQLVHTLPDPAITPPILGRDGALYGVTTLGGDIDGGTIYRLGQMLSLAKTAAAVSLGLAGIPGSTYELKRSFDLATWNTLSTFLIPASGSIPYSDTPPPAAAFYQFRPRSQ
jgi:uncharacterized repeat protein (TIGR03803 family)